MFGDKINKLRNVRFKGVKYLAELVVGGGCLIPEHFLFYFLLAELLLKCKLVSFVHFSVNLVCKMYIWHLTRQHMCTIAIFCSKLDRKISEANKMN